MIPFRARTLLCIAAIALGCVASAFAETPPAAAWATFLTNTNGDTSLKKLLPLPDGGFCMYSLGDRLLIRFLQDHTVSWEFRLQPGVNERLELFDADTLDGGDVLIALRSLGPAKLFGQTVAADHVNIARLRGSDGTPVFVRAVQNANITAMKARPGGGFWVAGYGSGQAQIGADPINIGADGIFLAQITTSVDWAITGHGSNPGYTYQIDHIGPSGRGDALRAIVTGSATGPWTIGGSAIATGGAYLLAIDPTGVIAAARNFGSNSTIDALGCRPGGGANVALHVNGEPSVARLNENGADVWSAATAAVISCVADGDDFYAVGYSTPEYDWLALAFDDFGQLRWQRTTPGRSRSAATACALLADGNLLFGGITSPTGIFIDDFFVHDFSMLNLVPSGIFLATLQTSATGAPVISGQPRDQFLTVVGETVTLHADVYSPSGANLQWYKGNVLLDGQNGSDLVLGQIQASGAGVYTLEAQNPFGTTRSRGAQVVVNSVWVTDFPTPELASPLDSPQSPLTLLDGSTIFAEPSLNKIKRITTSAVDYAGSGTAGLLAGLPLQAEFSNPVALALNTAAVAGPAVYVADKNNNTIRAIRLTPNSGDAARVDDLGWQINQPTALAVTEGLPQVVVALSNGTSLKIVDDGIATPVTAASSITNIGGIAFDERRNIFVSDASASAVYRISPENELTKLAGGDSAGFVDGDPATALLGEPTALALDTAGNVYFVDHANNAIRTISPQGAVTTIAGTGVAGHHNGSATEASFNNVTGLTFRDHSLIVSDAGNHTLREIRFESADSTSNVHIHAKLDTFLRLGATIVTGEQWVIESSPRIGTNAQWTVEGTIGDPNAEILLLPPSTPRFFRVRKL